MGWPVCRAGKEDKQVQKFLQKLEGVSQALLDPLSYLTAAGLLLVVGALLTSSPLRQLLPVLNWTPIRLAGGLLYNSMMVIINNLSIFLCVGIAAARTRTEKQEAALLALMAYLVFLTANHTTLEILGRLAESDGLTGLAATGQTSILGIQVMDTGVTGGILLGFAAAKIFDRTCETQFTGLVTQVYSGLRWSFLCLAVFAAAFGMAVCFVWPPLQEGIRAVTGWDRSFGPCGPLSVWLPRTAAHPHRPAPSHLYAVPVLGAGRFHDRGFGDVHGGLSGHDGGILLRPAADR